MPAPPTQRLYRDDADLTRFSARVVDSTTDKEGRLLVELDQTAFYPTGGGQPHDTGTLAGTPVLDVREAGDGRILHVLAAGAGVTGQVEGVVDRARRFDHMQQHSGQHILSRAFVLEADAPTQSFHLGAGHCTIDVTLPDAGEALIRKVERRANDVVFSDVAVEIRSIPAHEASGALADPAALADLALKPGDPVRVICFGEFDQTPCGGTHVSGAGQVGAISIRSWERFKGGTRVTFLCGGRVVSEMARLGRLAGELGSLLSVGSDDLPSAAARLQEQLVAARRLIKEQTQALIAAEAQQRAASARAAGSWSVLMERFDGRPVEEIQLLAQTFCAQPGRAALLACTDQPGGKASLVFARSAEPAGDLRMGEILASVCTPRGGKGGGGAAMARGGGLPAESASAALEEAFALVAARLGGS